MIGNYLDISVGFLMVIFGKRWHAADIWLPVEIQKKINPIRT